MTMEKQRLEDKDVYFLNYYNETPFKITYNDGGVYYCTAWCFFPGLIFACSHKDEEIEFDVLTDGKLELILIDPHTSSITHKRQVRQLSHKIVDTKGNVRYFADTPKSLEYGFINSIDMFDLIENGKAVDVESLPIDIKTWAHQKIKDKSEKFKDILKTQTVNP